MTGAVRSVAGLIGWGRRVSVGAAKEPHDPPPLPITRWDNVGLAVERSMQIFLPIAESIPGVTRIDAKSSGPSVHFLVTVEVPWHEVIDAIEAKLFALAHAGQLPPLDYDVREATEALSSPEPGYLQVFPA
jgi:hypothetical protein